MKIVIECNPKEMGEFIVELSQTRETKNADNITTHGGSETTYKGYETF